MARVSGSIVNCSSLNCSVAARYTTIDSGTREQLIQTVATCLDEHCYELKDMIHLAKWNHICDFGSAVTREKQYFALKKGAIFALFILYPL